MIIVRYVVIRLFAAIPIIFLGYYTVRNFQLENETPGNIHEQLLAIALRYNKHHAERGKGCKCEIKITISLHDIGCNYVVKRILVMVRLNA